MRPVRLAFFFDTSVLCCAVCVRLGGETPWSFTPGVDGVIGLNSATAFNTKLILFFPAQEAVFTGKKAGAFPGGSPQYGGRSDNDEEEAEEEEEQEAVMETGRVGQIPPRLMMCTSFESRSGVLLR